MSNCLTTRVLNLITDTDAKGTKKGNDKLMQMYQKQIFFLNIHSTLLQYPKNIEQCAEKPAQINNNATG